jgi:hypothetical protein
LPPANQRFECDNIARRHINDRLEKRQQFVVAFERVAQCAIALHLIQHLPPQLMTKHDEAVAARVFRTIHRNIGVAQEIGRLAMILAVRVYDADAA